MWSWNSVAPVPNASGGISFRMVRMIAPFGNVTRDDAPCANTAARFDPGSQPVTSAAAKPSKLMASRRFNRYSRKSSIVVLLQFGEARLAPVRNRQNDPDFLVGRMLKIGRILHRCGLGARNFSGWGRLHNLFSAPFSSHEIPH